MQHLGTFLIAVAFPCVVVGVVLMMSMAAALEARGHTIRWIFIRLFILEYVHRYREVTRREDGRTGPLFAPFVIAMNAALLLAVTGLILRFA